MTHSAAHPLPSSPSLEDEPAVERPNDDVLATESDVRDPAELRDQADVRDPAELRDQADLRDQVEPTTEDVEPRGSFVAADEDVETSAPTSERPSPDLSADRPEAPANGFDVPDEVDQPAVTDRNDNLAAADQADEPARAPSDGNLAPGAPTDDPNAPTWNAGGVERYRDQWRDLQLRFVDDPHAATSEAAGLVEEAVTSLTQRLTDQKASLDEWQSASRDDTEVLRVAMQRYRVFLDRLLAS